MMKPKVLAIACADNFTFFKDIAKALQGDGIDIHLHTQDNRSAIGLEYFEENDIVWFEWADGFPLALLLSDNARPFSSIKSILRIHRYELFNSKLLKLIGQIDPGRVQKLVFVSPYVKEIAVSKFKWMESGVVIPNLLDTDKFPFHDRERGFNLLFLGRISYVKNLPIMLNFFHELVQQDPRYKLHIVGDISDQELYYYMDNFLRKTGIKNSVKLYGRVDNEKLPELMKDMHYIVCSSIFESQGLGILEGMATGLKPLVYNFGGADYFFPDKYLFTDLDGFLGLVFEGEYSPKEYCDYVVERYSIKNNVYKYRDLIMGVYNDV